MFVSGSLVGMGPTPTRKFRIAATLASGSIVHMNSLIADVLNPGVNDVGPSLGVCLEAATYGVALGSVYAKCSYNPLQLVRGVVSGGPTADTAFPTTSILTTTGASTTVISAAGVSDLDYHNGYLIPLSGVAANIGRVRRILSQVDSTSTTITVQLPSATVAGDTFLRTYGPCNKGVELTTDLKQFNNLLTTGEDIHGGTPAGGFIVFDVFIDGQSCQCGDVVPASATAPVVEFECILYDHVFKSIG